MALVLGSNLAKGSIFELSDSESAFHPWWDSLQDYVMYTAIIVGLFSLSTANSVAECAPLYPNTTAPVHHTFVNKYCTEDVVPLFISYFPYLVFLGPSLLAVLEKFFSKASSIGPTMNHFYRLLVEDSKRRENLYRYLNSREAKEIENVYSKSSSFFMTYTLKNTLQFVISVAYLIWMIITSNGSIFLCEDGKCDIVNYRACKLARVDLTCLVANVHFYFYVLIILVVLMLIYVLANLFTLLWIGIRPIRKLGRFLSTYKSGVTRYYKGKPPPSEVEAILDVYGGIKSLDVEILLDLLSEKLGLEMALRILTLIDDEFSRDWRAQPRETGSFESGSTTATFEFDEPAIIRYIGSTFQNKTIFTAKLDLAGSDLGIVDSQSQAFLYSKGRGQAGQVGVSIEDEVDRVFNKRPQEFFVAKFKNLSPGRSYKVVLSTFLNGTLMAQTVSSVATRPEPPRDIDYKWKYDFSNSDIQFRLELSWSSPSVRSSKDGKYRVDIENSLGNISSSCNGEKYSIITTSAESHRVQIWTLSTINGDMMPSEEPLQAEIEPVPEDMQALADHLKKQNPPSDITSYAYRLAILGQVTKELKDLYEEIQRVASFSKMSGNNNNNDDEISDEAQALLSNAEEDSGLAEMDL